MVTPSAGWNIQWLTPEHGVVENLTRREADVLHHYLSDTYSVVSKRGVWWTRDPRTRLWSCEFHTHPYASIQFPWSLDGTTKLFTAWQTNEATRLSLKREFHVGDRVRFTNERGETYEGVISGGRKRATVIIPDSRVKWHVPYRMLEHVNDN